MKQFWEVLNREDLKREEDINKIIRGNLPTWTKSGWESFWVANYYQQEGKDELYFYYSYRAMKKGEIRGASNLGIFYEDNRNIEQMLYYYEYASIQGDAFAKMRLGCYYYDNNDIEKMSKYYLEACSLGHLPSMLIFGQYHLNNKNYTNAIQYWKLALEIDASCLELISNYYIEITSVEMEEMVAFYYENVEKYQDKESMYLLGKYTQDLTYYQMALNHGNLKAIPHLRLPFLSQITKKSLFCLQQEKYLKTHKTNTCPICYSNKYCNLYLCGHYVCYECFAKYNGCPFRCT
jgi:TPR repeat protein